MFWAKGYAQEVQKGKWWAGQRHCGPSAHRLAWLLLQAVELPLAYIYNDKFTQPILFCNNLAGKWWQPAGCPAQCLHALV